MMAQVLKYMAFLLFMGFTSDLIEAASTSTCKAQEWSCGDGTCIDAELRCNSKLDCPDGSDEAFSNCRTFPCNGFSCVNGGCAPKSAACNGVQDCLDNSDELLPECSGEKFYSACIGTKSEVESVEETLRRCFLKESTCKNGENIGSFIKCNGKVDCEDGSDETVESCAGTWLPNCIGWKFRCQYGGCVDYSKVCNGVIDCADGTDELDALCNSETNDEFKLKGEWNCKDGNRIKAEFKCNGAVDCPDGSDETFLTCRRERTFHCPFGFSRCVYGACIKNSAFCNGVQDCADNSDELLPECRNETSYAACSNRYQSKKNVAKTTAEKEMYEKLLQKCEVDARTCDNGQLLKRRHDKCNGKVDCEDGSDESLETCSAGSNIHDALVHNCGFRCQSGSCIDSDKVCDKVNDCSDGTDEHDGLCYEGKCVLPQYPKHGNYTVQDKPDARPGELLDVALLVFSCEAGYKLHGTSRYVNCLKGSWPYEPPTCLSQCRLEKHPSTTYWCLAKGPLATEGEKECGELVPDGAIVRPECSNSIFHYTSGVLPFIHCVDGTWNRQVPICSAQCGVVTSQGDGLIIKGVSAERGELPWHAAIYDKTKTPYEQICGGSLISQNIVISAAHCFWSDFQRLLPPKNFAVALGKLYRPWGDTHEKGDQKFNVNAIKVPPRYKGAEASFQEDIALVFLATLAQYRTYVLPVCLDFGITFERRQLATGNVGKVAGWGLTAQDGKPSPVLKVAELPYLDIDSCYAESPPSFYKFITGDKFCAGNSTSSALCKGDSGGGLVFASNEREEVRYFLRGVVSTAPRNDHLCNAFAHTTFTLVSKHQAFILEYWNAE